MEKILLTIMCWMCFVLFPTFAVAENKRSPPTSITELFVILNATELVFGWCIGQGKSLQEQCWEESKEGGIEWRGSSALLFNKNNTGKILGPGGYAEEFSWKENGDTVNMVTTPPSKLKLQNLLYLSEIEGTTKGNVHVLLNPEASTIIKKFRK